MPITLGQFSRFKYSDPIIVDGKETFGAWTRPDFLKKENVAQQNITKLVINQSNAGRPDLIAEEFYGTAELVWVVVMFNSPLNPIGWPKAGQVIQLPSPNTVFSNL